MSRGRRLIQGTAVVAIIAMAAALPMGCGSRAATPRTTQVQILVRNLSGRDIVIRVHAYGQVPAAAFQVPAVPPYSSGTDILQTVITDIIVTLNADDSATRLDSPIDFDVFSNDCSPLQLALQMDEVDSSGDGSSLEVSANGTVVSNVGGLVDLHGVPRTTTCLSQ